MIISLQEASSILYSISEKVESKLIGTTTHPNLRIEKQETIQSTELGKIIANRITGINIKFFKTICQISSLKI